MDSDEPSYYTIRGVKYQHPNGFRPDESRPHEAVPVKLGDTFGFHTFCAQDGQPWPCPHIRDEYMREHIAKHGNTRR